MTHLFITTVEMQVFLQQNNISVIPWLSKTTIIVIVYALGKPHPKSGTIRGWKEQLLTFQDNHYDLAADMTQHDEPDNKKGGGGSKAAWAGFKCHFKAPAQTHFQGERLSTHTEWDSSLRAPHGKPGQDSRPTQPKGLFMFVCVVIHRRKRINNCLGRVLEYCFFSSFSQKKKLCQAKLCKQPHLPVFTPSLKH